MTERMYLPKLILPWTKTSDLSANARGGWKKRHRLTVAQRKAADAIAREAGWHKQTIPDDAKLHMRLIYCPPSRGGVPDDDNVLAAHKGARDAFAAVLKIDDRRIRGEAVLGERCKDGGVIVLMEILPEEGGFDCSNWQHIGQLAERLKEETRARLQPGTGQTQPQG